VIRTLRTAIATVLLLAAGNALALGLGQIEVKSRINQPLLAEIPIISTTPGELQALQARLASPDTFRRVGLEPPQGIAADLRFSLGNDARGRPVIRVTTTAPVNQAVLNFLIEVDWGQGRLVREYSALVDAPRTASAPLQPAISAPVAAAPNVVKRPAAPLPAATPAAAQVETPIATAPLSPAPKTTPAPMTMAPAPAVEPIPPSMPAAEPAPASTAITPPPRQPRPAAAPTPPRTVAAAVSTLAAKPPSQYGPVKAGESLSKIARGLDQTSSYSLDQTMLALLRANPDAFLSDNINLLRQGAVLRVPGGEVRGSISTDEAKLVVREQMQQWRQTRRPVLQPDAAVAGNATKRDVTPGKVKQATSKPAPIKPAGTAKSAATAAVAAKPAKAPSQVQARLEIVPAAVPGKATGTKSGTSAGSEGSMLQQQLQQRDEDLAARKAEVSDLKERVAELEKLKQQQAQLLTMKDSELAAAQQRLADARTAASAAAAKQPAQAATQATQTTQAVKEPQQPHASNFMPWLWSGLAVVGLGLLAWLLSRRRPARVAPAPRRSFDSAALAASMRRPVEVVAVAPQPEDATTEVEAVALPTATQKEVEQVNDVTDLPTTPAAQVETPTWHSGHWVKAGSEPIAAASTVSEPRFVPPVEQLLEPLPEAATAEQRMKLARAFLDIGDEHSAKQLLIELKEAAADSMLRTEASKLLRDLR
jgi:pilus assembly protein FimV